MYSADRPDGARSSKPGGCRTTGIGPVTARGIGPARPELEAMPDDIRHPQPSRRRAALLLAVWLAAAPLIAAPALAREAPAAEANRTGVIGIEEGQLNAE